MLYKTNINAIINSDSTINLGAVYETVVAQELKCHGHELYYFDRRKLGEVDFLIDDYDSLSVVPIEVKSGKNTVNYRALPKMTQEQNYHIAKGIVLSNEQQVIIKDKIVHLPIYYVMFL